MDEPEQTPQQTPQQPPSPWQSPKFTGEPWWTKDTVVLVTGSNRGIGFETIRELAKRGLTTILTDKDDTTASMAALKAEGLSNFVVSHPLDVTSSTSVAILASWVQEKFGGIDILINNAGVLPRTVGPAQAESVIGVNYFGCKAVTEVFIPLLRSGGRIINVTSRLGFYQRLRNEEMKNMLQNVEALSFEKLDGIANKYLKDLKTGNLDKEGWVPAEGFMPQYSESKMLLSAYTILLSKNLQTGDLAKKKLVACAFCPRLTATEMTRGFENLGMPLLPVEVSVDTSAWLALLSPEEFSQKQGKLITERVEYPYTWVPWIDPFVPPA